MWFELIGRRSASRTHVALSAAVLRAGARAPRCVINSRIEARTGSNPRLFYTRSCGVTKDNSAKDKISLPNTNRAIVTGGEQDDGEEKTRVARNPRRTFDLANARYRSRLRSPSRGKLMRFGSLLEKQRGIGGLEGKAAALLLTYIAPYLSDRIAEERGRYTDAGFRGSQFATRSGGFALHWKCCRLVAQLINRSIAYAERARRSCSRAYSRSFAAIRNYAKSFQS